MPDLKKMLEERQAHPMMKARNDAYAIFWNYINSQGKNGKVQLTFKPFAPMDVRGTGEGGDHKLAINLCRRVHSYFTSTFSRVPATWKLPSGMEAADKDKAERLTFWLQQVLDASRADAAQPRQASWLSGRGDCVYALDYDDEKGEVYVRTYDPEWCYPTLEPFDVGGVQDMLISFQVPTKWVEETYKITVKGEKKAHVQLYHYWDATHFEVQVNNQALPNFTRQHDLGFCPFRWVFGSADGNFAQSDIRDIPSLQDFYNENLLLAMDSIRKSVDKAWIAFGVNKDIVPKPGTAIAVKDPNAKLEEFPSGADPQIIMSVMSMLESGVESSAGISSASARGQVHGLATGAAIRNQVQAVEARNEARKQALEDAYAMVGNYAMRVLEKRFKEKKIKVMTPNGYQEVTGDDVGGHYLCSAEYGGFVGMDLAQRIQGALMGLGRIYDDKEAIRLAALPGVNPLEMAKRIDDYQQRLAISAAKSQSMAQFAMSNTGEPSPQQMGQPQLPPGAMPQQALPAPAPAPSQVGVTTLADIERTIQVLRSRLHGDVWAVGELAIAGLSARPLLMVSSEKDLGPVTALMQALKTHVLPGHPGEMPSLKIA